MASLGFSIDRRLGLGIGELGELAGDADRLGYRSLWTTGATFDPFQLCADWARRTAGPDDGDGPTVGIAIVPVDRGASPVDIAMAAATAADLTGGRFVLGLGVGHPRERAPGDPPDSPIALATEYLAVIRRLLDGETVDHRGTYVRLAGASLGWKPRPVPIYLGALGPAMLRLAGAAADGVFLNWCHADHVAWSRDRIAEGASTAGRSPDAVHVVSQIRVAIDDDADLARAKVARQFVSMMLRSPREASGRGYRGHAERLGYGDLIADLADRQDAGASTDDLIAVVPADTVDALAYAGPAADAAAAVARLAGTADVANIRCIRTGGGPERIVATLDACRSLAVDDPS